jgi:hypothetical protein
MLKLTDEELEEYEGRIVENSMFDLKNYEQELAIFGKQCFELLTGTKRVVRTNILANRDQMLMIFSTCLSALKSDIMIDRDDVDFDHLAAKVKTINFIKIVDFWLSWFKNYEADVLLETDMLTKVYYKKEIAELKKDIKNLENLFLEQ